jgi:hypothetical protein
VTKYETTFIPVSGLERQNPLATTKFGKKVSQWIKDAGGPVLNRVER